MKVFDIMGKRKYFFALSIIVILAGFVGYLINGLQLDIQFQGGTIIQVQVNDNSFDTATVESVVGGAINKTVTAQKMQAYNPEDPNAGINLLQLKVSSEDTLTDTEFNKVVEVLRSEFGVKPDAEMDVKSVQPFIGKEMMQKGVNAIVISSILIILYVWWRYSVMSGLAAAVFAVLALFHDAAVMLAVYTIFKVPVNELFVAAILTILGYSMNDTIIVYDRVRENSRLMKKADLFELVNISTIQTLSRSINTLVTTVINVLTVYIFASASNIQSLKDFTLPLLVGLISGAYSSIFIAGPLWAIWKKSTLQKKVKARTAKAR